MLPQTPQADTGHKRQSSLRSLFGFGQVTKAPARPEISAPIQSSPHHIFSPQVLQAKLRDLTVHSKRDSSHLPTSFETPPKRRSYLEPGEYELTNNDCSNRQYMLSSHSANSSLSESLHTSESHCMSETQPHTPQSDCHELLDSSVESDKRANSHNSIDNVRLTSHQSMESLTSQDDAITPYVNGTKSFSRSVLPPKPRVASAGAVTRKPVSVSISEEPKETIMNEFQHELARLDSIGTFTELPPPVSHANNPFVDKLAPHPALMMARNTAPGSQRPQSLFHQSHSHSLSVSSTATDIPRESSQRQSFSGKFGKLKNLGRRFTNTNREPDIPSAPSPRLHIGSPKPSDRRRSIMGFNFSSTNVNSIQADRRTATTSGTNIHIAPIINMRFDSEKPQIERGY